MKNKDKKEKNTNKRDNIFMIILSFCDVRSDQLWE